MLRDFVAIDFETANRELSSVCSVGLVVVRDGQIAERIYNLIRPRPNHYNEGNSYVHGLVYHDTVDAPEFPEVWKEVMPKIERLPLVAHNARFDEGCLKAAFKAYGMDYPDYTFYCTCLAAKRMFGRSLPNHKLPTVSRECGFVLDNHHNALADAEACAVIAMHIL